MKIKKLESEIQELKTVAKAASAGLKKIEKELVDLKLVSKWVSVGRVLFYNNADRWTTAQKKHYLRQECYRRLGYYPDLRNPKTFNEKLHWLKFNYYDPVQTYVADKATFKDWITEKIGSEYVIPTIAVYDDIDDINEAVLETLPDRFVIKTTNGYGAQAVKIIKDKSNFDLDKFKYEFSPLLQEWKKLYYYDLERDYLEINPRIIIEEYREDSNGELNDYKFFCFHGEPKLIEAIRDRAHGDFRASFYDTDWVRQDLRSGNHENAEFAKPQLFDKMLEISRKLSREFPHVRVDLYACDDRIYVGELTFYHGGAFSQFNPRSWDYQLGEYLDLNKLNPDLVNILPEFQPKSEK